MPSTVTAPTLRWLVLAGAAATVVLMGTALLWAHFGKVVFFETIRTGFAACFG
jgi:acyl-CoA hydrolase